ncbi:MAG: DUF4116 domain-containing protein [Patescibacteria group bacterium]
MTTTVNVRDLINFIDFCAGRGNTDFTESMIESLNNFPMELQLKIMSPETRILSYIRNKTPELCRLAVAENPSALQFVPEELITTELCRLAVENCGTALHLVPKSMITPELCRLAVDNYGNSLEYVPEKFRTSEVCGTAVRKSKWAIKFVPDNLKTLEFMRTNYQETC